MSRPSILSPIIHLAISDLTNVDLMASPMAINGMKLLRYAKEEGGIPLTKTNRNFHRRCVEWAAEDFQWPGHTPADLYAVNKVLNEPDMQPLWVLHGLFLDTRLMRHFKGKAVLTKAGTSMLGNFAELQALLTEHMLVTPIMDRVPREAMRIFWDIGHMLSVVSNRLDDWVTLGEMTPWLVPVDLFHTRGALTPLFSACLYTSTDFVRPLKWLGLLEEHPEDRPATALEKRRYRKTRLFGQALRVLTLGPNGKGKPERAHHLRVVH